MLSIINITSFKSFDLVRYDYKTVETETKEIRYLSNQDLTAETAFLCLSGSDAGLLSTLAYSHPCCAVCSHHSFPLPSGMPFGSTMYIWIPLILQIPERNSHLYLETFHHHPSHWQIALLSAARSWYSHSLPCTVMSVFFYSFPSNYTVSSLEMGICLVFLTLQSLII